MKRVVLVSGHYFESKRKAGFHWLADAYWKKGWEVVFITAPISLFSIIRRDHRMAYPVIKEANRLKFIDKGLVSYVLFTSFHPVDLRINILNNWSRKIFSLYSSLNLGALENLIKEADLVVFESTAGILLFERFKCLNARARYVYRVSDDMSRLLKVHPIVKEAEDRFSPLFDLVSVPSDYIYQRFSHLSNSVLQYHGINKTLFDDGYANPYQTGTINLVLVGTQELDDDFLKSASHLFPKWLFHIIGPFQKITGTQNLIFHGELPFLNSIPYIKFADIGLQTIAYKPGAESLTNSLRIIQYTYCRLPILSPDFLRTSQPHIFYYQPGNADSIKKALWGAIKYDRKSILTEDIRSWDELSNHLVEN